MTEPLKILCLFDYLLQDGKFKFDKFLGIISESNFFGETSLCYVRDLESFDFSKIHEFDILFLFGMASKLDGMSCKLKEYPRANAEITKFMAAGKGLFGTGDHGSLGFRLCGNVPRLRFMREWENNPNSKSVERLTTTRPTGLIESEGDQRDNIPQRIYPYIFENNRPHYLLQTNYDAELGKNYINFFPDHAHEGECLVPAAKSPIYQHETEFPPGAKIEAVAKSMSAGAANSDGGPAVIPREFISISVYDGFKSGVGRIVCDATWHHFLDMNLEGIADSNDPKLQQVYERIKRYYVNIVTVSYTHLTLPTKA